MPLPMEDEELYQRTQINVPIPDIGEQEPIAIPDRVTGGRESLQQESELLTRQASQDPSQPLRSGDSEGTELASGWDAPSPSLNTAPADVVAGALSRNRNPAITMGRAPAQPPAEREEAPSSGGGFDWARALWAATGGDIGSFDASRIARQNAPLDRALKQEQLNDYSLRKQAARDAIDPGSNASLMAQKQYAEDMNGRAQQLRQMGKAVLAKEFEERAKQAPTMNAVQIASAMKSPRMSEVLRMIDSMSRNDLAAAGLGIRQQQVGATMQDQAADNSRQWAQLGEQQRHNLATEEHAKAMETKADLKITKAQQEKLNQEISDLTVAKDNMEKLLKTKETVNTGPVAGRVQRLLSKVDLAPDDFVELRALGARVFNKETKSLAGTAVSAGEWSRIAPQIPEDTDDDRTYAIKMQKALEVTKQILEQRKKQYQMLNGKPIDRSVTAMENAPEMPAEIPDGTRGRNKKTGEMLIRRGGKWVPE